MNREEAPGKPEPGLGDGRFFLSEGGRRLGGTWDISGRAQGHLGGQTSTKAWENSQRTLEPWGVVRPPEAGGLEMASMMHDGVD